MVAAADAVAVTVVAAVVSVLGGAQNCLGSAAIENDGTCQMCAYNNKSNHGDVYYDCSAVDFVVMLLLLLLCFQHYSRLQCTSLFYTTQPFITQIAQID